jgi:hypothetical protein
MSVLFVPVIVRLESCASSVSGVQQFGGAFRARKSSQERCHRLCVPHELLHGLQA